MKHQPTAAICNGQCEHLFPQPLRHPILFLVFLFLFTTAALAQLTTADILGTVTDSTGASVANATVTLTNLGTNQQRTVQSNASGDYTFTLLPIGHYSISVKSSGFQESITKDLAVEAGDRARADVHLQVGSASAVVEVTATTPLLQADSATMHRCLCVSIHNDVLSLSKMEERAFQLEYRPFDMAALITSSIKRFQTSINENSSMSLPICRHWMPFC